MPTAQHEQIIDDIATILHARLRPALDGGTWGILGPFMLLAEDAQSVTFTGNKYLPRADLMIGPYDGAGWIPVEVGTMTPENKWDTFLAEDNQPFRVLRVAFYRGVGLVRPRGTSFERALLECLRRWL